MLSNLNVDKHIFARTDQFTKYVVESQTTLHVVNKTVLHHNCTFSSLTDWPMTVWSLLGTICKYYKQPYNIVNILSQKQNPPSSQAAGHISSSITC